MSVMGQAFDPLTIKIYSHCGTEMFPVWDYDVPSKGLFVEVVSLSGFWISPNNYKKALCSQNNLLYLQSKRICE